MQRCASTPRVWVEIIHVEKGSGKLTCPLVMVQVGEQHMVPFTNRVWVEIRCMFRMHLVKEASNAVLGHGPAAATQMGVKDGGTGTRSDQVVLLVAEGDKG